MSFITAPTERKIHPWRKTITLREGLEDFLPYEVTMPEPPPLEEFVNYGLPPEEQFFQREKIPEWVWRLTKTASISPKKAEEVADAANSNTEYRNFIASQWDKRRNGVFMYVYGVPLWIPGSYWWFLNFYYIEGDLPDFRMVDLEFYLWWELCVMANDNVYGGIMFTIRRGGKSVKLGGICLEMTTRTPFFKAGLQSKTNDDSKDLFQRAIVLPWHRLPFFFAPKFDNKIYPVKEINFRDPKNKDNEASHFASPELNSWIEARPTVYTAFDGIALGFYGFDECGKVSEMDASKAWRVHKQCLRERGKIKGKALLTTTVEEMTKGGMSEFIKIWDTSNRKKLTQLGQTESGLIPYFISAQETFVFDQYGFSIIKEPQLHQKRWRYETKQKFWDLGAEQIVEHEINSVEDPNEKQSVIRMYPRNIKEAFRTDIKNCHFNLGKIVNRLDYFRYGNDLVVTGNLFWVDGIMDDKVEFREQPNGRWQFKKSMLGYLTENANNTKILDGKMYPGNRSLGVIGCDPYKYDKVEDVKRRSMGVAYAYLGHIPSIDGGDDEALWQSDDLVMRYAFRGLVSMYNEDIILSCVFLGLPVCSENMSGDVNQYLTNRGYDKFLKFRKKIKKKEGHVIVVESVTPGYNTLGDSTKKPLFDVVDDYIEYKCHRCVFPEFLEDCQRVEYDNFNPYDDFVAGSNAIYDATMGNLRIKRPEMKKNVSSGLWTPQVAFKTR